MLPPGPCWVCWGHGTARGRSTPPVAPRWLLCHPELQHCRGTGREAGVMLTPGTPMPRGLPACPVSNCGTFKERGLLRDPGDALVAFAAALLGVEPVFVSELRCWRQQRAGDGWLGVSSRCCGAGEQQDPSRELSCAGQLWGQGGPGTLSPALPCRCWLLLAAAAAAGRAQRKFLERKLFLVFFFFIRKCRFVKSKTFHKNIWLSMNLPREPSLLSRFSL